jgi:hypothetical protein
MLHVRMNDNPTPLQLYERLIWDGITLGRFLGIAFREERPLVAVDAAGAVPYASGLPSLDMLGLTDAHIARLRSANVGRGVLGHELGDGAYVLSRKPDFVTFCLPAGNVEPCFRSEREMAASPVFQRDYRLVWFWAEGVTGAVWTRIEGGRVGIVRSSDTVHIPGFLLATTDSARAVLDAAGKPVALLEGGKGVIRDVYVPPGTWEISLQTAGSPSLQLTASDSVAGVETRSGVLHLVSKGTVRSFHVVGRGRLYGITLKRTEPSGMY